MHGPRKPLRCNAAQRKARRRAAGIVRLRRSALSPTGARLVFDGLGFPAAIGRAGLTTRKREGDGATPIAAMRLLCGYVRRDRVGRVAARLPLYSARHDLGWCDAPSHGRYNRPVRLPFPTSHETMMRADTLYDLCLVMDWNIISRRRNRGSAIFIHVARPGFAPTEGCIAVAPAALRRLLSYARRGTLVIVG